MIGRLGRLTRILRRPVTGPTPAPPADQPAPPIVALPPEDAPDVEASQWWCEDTIAEYQSRRLRWLVQYVYDEIPFYRERFRQHGLRPSMVQGIDDLRALPPVNRAILRANYDRILNPAQVMTEAYTGGSTGERLRWAYSLRWLDLFAKCVWRGYQWEGLTPETRLVSFYSRVVGQVCPTSLMIREAFDRDRIEADLAEAVAFRPEAALCYASSAYTVARYLLATGRTLPLRTVITSSEALLPHYIPAIEQAFCCKVYDNYGCNDGGSWGAQCAERSGFHHDVERNIIEFTDDGKILATDLWNTAFPFLRYENGDAGEWLDGDCACGRQSPRFRIHGRAQDMLVTPTRVLAPAMVSQTLLYQGLDAARVVQHSATDVEVLIVPNERFTPEGFRPYQEALESLLSEMTLRYTLVTEIPSSLSGKLRVSVNLSGIGPESVLGTRLTPAE